MGQVQTDVLIHYDVTGTGPPVLWHTGGCGDGRMWQLAGYVDGLPGYTHVLMDHRGHGRSEAPSDLHGHQMARYVDDVVAVLDDAGLDRATFVGYSLGARVGYAVAMAVPDRLDALVALDSVPTPDETPDDLRDGVEDVLTRGTRAVLEEMAAHEAEPTPDWLVEHLCETSTPAFAGAWEAFATTGDVWTAAPDLAVPTLVLVGVGPDDAQWREQARRFADRLPHGESYAIEGVEHLAAFHRIDLTLPPVRAFLETVSRRT